MKEEEIEKLKEKPGPKIKYEDPWHEYQRRKQREYYWKRKQEKKEE